MVAFLGVTADAERLARRIRRLLGSRPAVHLDELRMRLGMDKTAVQAALGALMERGEVERLRPIDCSREDHDFYRVNRPAPTCAVQKWREHVRLSGMSVAWLAD